MTLIQLRHLIALADCGSFSRAALRVHLTQPALSRSIRALEDELGVPLVDRIGRRIELTAIGRDTLERARRLLLDAQELSERGKAIASGRFGHLRVGMGSGPAAILMNALLLEVAVSRPQWRVEVARGATALLVQRLRERTLDALVVDVRSLEPASDLEVSLVHELRGAFLVRPGHPLTRRRELRFADLAAYPLASIPLSDEVARLVVEHYGPQAHPDQAVTIRCEDVASLVSVASHSDAVLLAVRAAAPGLRELRLSPPFDVAARLGLVTLVHRAAPAGFDLLRELILARMVEPAPHAAGMTPVTAAAAAKGTKSARAKPSRR